MSTYGVDPYDVSGDLPGVTNPEDDLNRDASAASTYNPGTINPTIPTSLPTPGQAAAGPVAGDELAAPTDMAPPSGAPDLGPAAAMMGAGAVPPPAAPLNDDELAQPDLGVPAPGGGPGMTPAPLEPLGEIPKRPTVTGDHARDAKAFQQYENDLEAWKVRAAQHKAAIEKQAAATNIAANNAEITRQNEQIAQRKKDREAADLVRAQRYNAIDAKIRQKEAAEQDLTKGYWADKGTGDKVWAALMIATGALGQGLQNAAAAKLGQVGQAQNQGLHALNKLMDDDYKKKQDRIAGLKDDILEAKYGVKDADDARRMAENENDAEAAAKWNVFGLEAKNRLAQQGMSLADIEQNEVVIKARDQADQHREQIIARTAAADEHKREFEINAAHAQRMEKIMAANAAANRSLRTTAADEKRDEKAEKARIALEERTLRSPLNNEPIGLAPTPRVVAQMGKDLAAGVSYVDKVRELADHIEQYGRLFDPKVWSREDVKRRQTLIAEVQAQGRQLSGIQASDAGQKLEHMMIGGEGTNWEAMANPDVLRELADRAYSQMEMKLRSTLAPLPGQERVDLSGVRGGEKPTAKAEGGGGGKPAPPEAPKGKGEGEEKRHGGLDVATGTELMKVAADPKAPPARRKQANDMLKAAGWI